MLLLSLASCAMGCAWASAQVLRYTATVGHPALIPLATSPEASPANDTFRYVDITVWRFRPAPSGPVQVTVEAPSGSSLIEIGRFGIYPEQAFAATDSSQVQRFRLTIPAGLRLNDSSRLKVNIVPTRGSGKDASIEVEAGLLR